MFLLQTYDEMGSFSGGCFGYGGGGRQAKFVLCTSLVCSVRILRVYRVVFCLLINMQCPKKYDEMITGNE
jgi:hypothetical protein